VDLKVWADIVGYLHFGQFPKYVHSKDTKKNFKKKCSKFEYNQDKNKLYYLGTRKVFHFLLLFNYFFIYVFYFFISNYQNFFTSINLTPHCVFFLRKKLQVFSKSFIQIQSRVVMVVVTTCYKQFVCIFI